MDYVAFFIGPAALAFLAGLLVASLRQALFISFVTSFMIFGIAHYRAYNLPTNQVRVSTFVILSILYSGALLVFVFLAAKLRQRSSHHEFRQGIAPDVPNPAIVIAAEPHEVFPYLCRPELMLRWSLGVKSIEAIEGDAYAPGSILLSRTSWMSGVREVHTKVLESNPPWRFVTEEQIGGMTMIQTFVLEKVEEGTKAECIYRVTKSGGIYGLILRVQPDAFTKQIGVVLPRLKKAVEEPDKSRATKGFHGHLWESLKATPRVTIGGFLACFVGGYLFLAAIRSLSA